MAPWQPVLDSDAGGCITGERLYHLRHEEEAHPETRQQPLRQIFEDGYKLHGLIYCLEGETGVPVIFFLSCLSFPCTGLSTEVGISSRNHISCPSVLGGVTRHSSSKWKWGFCGRTQRCLRLGLAEQKDRGGSACVPQGGWHAALLDETEASIFSD